MGDEADVILKILLNVPQIPSPVRNESTKNTVRTLPFLVDSLSKRATKSEVPQRMLHLSSDLSRLSGGRGEEATEKAELLTSLVWPRKATRSCADLAGAVESVVLGYSKRVRPR